MSEQVKFNSYVLVLKTVFFSICGVSAKNLPYYWLDYDFQGYSCKHVNKYELKKQSVKLKSNVLWPRQYF